MRIISVIILGLFVFASCSKDDDDPIEPIVPQRDTTNIEKDTTILEGLWKLDSIRFFRKQYMLYNNYSGTFITSAEVTTKFEGDQYEVLADEEIKEDGFFSIIEPDTINYGGLPYVDLMLGMVFFHGVNFTLKRVILH